MSALLLMVLISLFSLVLVSAGGAEPPKAAFAPRGQDSPPPDTDAGNNNELEGSSEAVTMRDERMSRSKRWTAIYWRRHCYYNFLFGLSCTPRYVENIRYGPGGIADFYQQMYGGYGGGGYSGYGGYYGSNSYSYPSYYSYNNYNNYGTGYGGYGGYSYPYYNSYSSYYPSYSSYYYG